MVTVVAIITSMVVANATQTITTPNAAYITYNLAANTTSAPIMPVTNKSVLVMGCCTTNRGVGHVSLLHSPGAGFVWAGVDYAGGVTQGSDNMGGRHIVYLDSLGYVEIVTASADTILIHNADTVTKAGNVTLLW